MHLTNKSKEAFEKWKASQRGHLLIFEAREFTEEKSILVSDAMKFGVLVDFFDSVGLNILLTVEFDFGYIITENRYEEIEEVIRLYDTRNEARKESIKKANELFNNR